MVHLTAGIGLDVMFRVIYGIYGKGLTIDCIKQGGDALCVLLIEVHDLKFLAGSYLPHGTPQSCQVLFT